MAYQALYRKYRPQTFDDFIDQESVKKILVNALKNNKISHAYLFSGPRGIGKTSMAKIFAKAINCLNFSDCGDVCQECINCIECENKSVDILEIDAASNNGVDQIRDLKNKINIVPSVLKYKIYIVDEVHMLTNSAFNALLKTLEEPPSHVIFILATTEFYSVPETIISRCQCFSFSRITLESLKKRLRMIADKENISIDDNVIEEISIYSNGGLRDAISMLDKLASFTNNKIVLEDFKMINGLISFEDVEKFYSSIYEGDYKAILEIINKIDKSGYDFKNFIERLMMYTRDKIIDYYTNDKEIKPCVTDNIDLIVSLNEILNLLKETLVPLTIVEVNILKYVGNMQKNKQMIISQEIICEEKEPKSEKKTPIKKEENISREIKNNVKMVLDNEKIKDKSLIIINDKVKKTRINNALATANISLKKKLMNEWNNVNNYIIDKKHGRAAQLIVDALPSVVGQNNVILTCKTDGMIDKIYSNIEIVEEFVSKLNGDITKIVLLKENEFDEIKNKYVNDKKNNITYEIVNEDGVFIKRIGDSLINKALDVFGSDFVEIEEEK